MMCMIVCMRTNIEIDDKLMKDMLIAGGAAVAQRDAPSVRREHGFGLAVCIVAILRDGRFRRASRHGKNTEYHQGSEYDERGGEFLQFRHIATSILRNRNSSAVNGTCPSWVESALLV